MKCLMTVSIQVAIILEGKAELTFGDEKIIVSKGDELFMDASTPDIHWQGCASVTRTEAGIKVSNTLIFISKVSRIDSQLPTCCLQFVRQPL